MRKFVTIFALFHTVLLVGGFHVKGSDHADPLVLNPLESMGDRGGRLSDLYVFYDSDQNGNRDPEALVLVLCTNSGIPPLAIAERSTGEATTGDGRDAESKKKPATVFPDLDLDGIRYSICLDLDPEVDFSDRSMRKRYGGRLLNPFAISDEIVISFELNSDDAGIRGLSIEGLNGGQPEINSEGFTPGKVNVRGGVFDDPFTLPRFSEKNVVGVVVSIPLELFDSKPHVLLAWATAYKEGQKFDHVGRAGRTQLPRFDILNTLHPRSHESEILRRHMDPTLLEDIMSTGLSPLFAHRSFDVAADVAIFRLQEKVDKKKGTGNANSGTPEYTGNVIGGPKEAGEYRSEKKEKEKGKRKAGSIDGGQSVSDPRGEKPEQVVVVSPSTPGPGTGKKDQTETRPERKGFQREGYRLIPADFPNGRKLDDDVIGELAEAGEAQLLEAAFSDKMDYPRETAHPIAFLKEFPYLLRAITEEDVRKKDSQKKGGNSHWSNSEEKKEGGTYGEGDYGHSHSHSSPGGTTVTNSHEHSDHLQYAALGRPNLTEHSWRTLGRIVVALLVLLVVLVAWCLQSPFLTGWSVAILVLACFWLIPVFQDNIPPSDFSEEAMRQPHKKLLHLLTAGGVVAVLYFLWVFLAGRQLGIRKREFDEKVPVGKQEITEEDKAYSGSSYREVDDALFELNSCRPYYQKWRGPGEEPLPVHFVPFRVVVRGLLRGLKKFAFWQAQKRTLASGADLRWGKDKKGFLRLLHPNGVCLKGKWIIDASPRDGKLSGGFAEGSELPIIARYSSNGRNVEGGKQRSLSLVGKVFPKGADERDEKVIPAHFFTQEDIAGNFSESIREGEMTNSPPVTVLNRQLEISTFLLTLGSFIFRDRFPAERQLYQIAELDLPPGAPTSCPRFLRLKPAVDTLKIDGENLDCRAEILDILSQGKPLVFDLSVSNSGERVGLIAQKVEELDWERIGRIEFTEAVASYNGDFVVHFRHPPWRNDRNDPDSVAFPKFEGRKSD